MPCIVKELEESDIEETILMSIEAWNHSYELNEKDYYPMEAHEFDMSQNTYENYRKFFGDAQTFCFIALVDGTISGKISGQIVGKSGFGMIRNIVVHPDHHRQGVGRKLMEAAIAHFRKKSCHKVSLYTLPVLLPAINLYLKTGFVPESYLVKQWWGVDFIYMSIWLDK